LTKPVVELHGLRFQYPGASRLHSDQWILRDLDLEIERGTTLGIIGESGAGKSTLVRILCGLLNAGEGSASYKGREISDWLKSDPREFRRQNQMVFQSPANSFDPRMLIRRSLAEPVRSIERRKPGRDELTTWLAGVGLGPEALERYPHQLSGGQLQRVALARALSLGPNVLYADEPTSALDVSVQAQVLNLLMDLGSRLGLTLVMVSHDLAVISRLCEKMVVMQHGRIVESGVTVDIMRRPSSDYTASLIQASEAVSLSRRARLESGLPVPSDRPLPTRS
jgi:ABC-type glutathione transport system ATPase component